MPDPEIYRAFEPRKLTPEQLTDQRDILKAAKGLAELIDHLLARSRERALALTKLEEATLWALEAIARQE